MNKNTILKITIASGLSFFVVGGTVATLAFNKPMKQVSAYSISTLPTTIDLNDCTASEIKNYYSDLIGQDSDELKGLNLLKNLKPILKKNQKYYSYDYEGSNIWKMYEIIDRDWVKSPASSTTYGTYNSSTNKITGYTGRLGRTFIRSAIFIEGEKRRSSALLPMVLFRTYKVTKIPPE